MDRAELREWANEDTALAMCANTADVQAAVRAMLDELLSEQKSHRGEVSSLHKKIDRLNTDVRELAEDEAALQAQVAEMDEALREVVRCGEETPDPTREVEGCHAALTSAPRVLARGRVIGACFSGRYDGENELRPGEIVLHVSVDDAFRVGGNIDALLITREEDGRE